MTLYGSEGGPYLLDCSVILAGKLQSGHREYDPLLMLSTYMYT